ncbi:MAG: GNAT family N-acetyltransferase [Lachnospiraceae bacterium]|nr:GNAT family N-acetyltransferase [Lachnospiraceae bacterium]
MIYKITDTTQVSLLFGRWEETLIWSCLQGMMGNVYADDLRHPTAAMAVLGDFTFFAGKPDRELASYNPDPLARNFRILVPQNRRWETVITQIYGEKASIVSRYATKKEPDVFDRVKLEKAAASLPKPYRLSMIDEPLFRMCRANPWSADLVSQFPDYQTYRKLGIGAVLCQENQIISGASSYARYRDGIEIEIDTREDCRRKGFAYICGAKLISECLKRNLYPSWDAHNKASIALAEKLGYHYSHTYRAIEIRE